MPPMKILDLKKIDIIILKEAGNYKSGIYLKVIQCLLLRWIRDLFIFTISDITILSISFLHTEKVYQRGKEFVDIF